MGWLKDLLFPPRCVFCRSFTQGGEDAFCGNCQRELPWLFGRKRRSKGEFFSECVSPLQYSDNARKALLRYKFGGKRVYSRVFGRIMAGCVLQEYKGGIDAVTWVPISRRRLRSRGYDQARLLAQEISAQLGIPCLRLLKKNKDNPAQSSLTAASQRKGNVLGVYEAVGGPLQCRRVLLVDDIVTTGATLGEAARMLVMSGVEEVLCVTLAKSELKGKKN